MENTYTYQDSIINQKGEEEVFTNTLVMMTPEQNDMWNSFNGTNFTPEERFKKDIALIESRKLRNPEPCGFPYDMQ